MNIKLYVKRNHLWIEMISRKKLALIGICLAVVAVGSALYTQFTAPPKIEVVVGPFSAQYIVTYALENGIVESPPVEIKHTLNFNKYMMTGRGDIGEISTAAFAIAYEKGIPLKVACIFASTCQEMGDALVFVKNNSDIDGPKDLKGKKVGVPGLKTTTTTIFLEMLKSEYGVTEKDLDLVDKPLPELSALLDRGDIDAALMFGEPSVKAYYSGKYKVIWDVNMAFKQKYGESPPASLIVVRSGYLEEHEDRAKAVIESLRESKSYGEEHVDEILERYAGEHGGDVETYKKFHENYYRLRLDPLTDEDKEVIMTVFEFTKDRGLVTKVPNPDKVFVTL